MPMLIHMNHDYSEEFMDYANNHVAPPEPPHFRYNDVLVMYMLAKYLWQESTTFGSKFDFPFKAKGYHDHDYCLKLISWMVKHLAPRYFDQRKTSMSKTVPTPTDWDLLPTASFFPYPSENEPTDPLSMLPWVAKYHLYLHFAKKANNIVRTATSFEEGEQALHNSPFGYLPSDPYTKMSWDEHKSIENSEDMINFMEQMDCYLRFMVGYGSKPNGPYRRIKNNKHWNLN